METDSETLYIFQKGFNYSQDGPGNRLIYHLAGCNLFCPWCSNPEGMKQNGGKERKISDLVKEVLSCRMMLFEGGGVTLTGGEVACQADGAAAFLKALQSEGIHTCIESNVSLPAEEKIMPFVDYMIADFKSPDEKSLLKMTGANIETVKINLKKRAASGKPLLVRIPLIHSFNSGPENAAGFVSFFKELSEVAENDKLFFEILPYHEFGREKWEKLGLPYQFENGFVSADEIKLLHDALINSHLTVIKT